MADEVEEYDSDVDIDEQEEVSEHEFDEEGEEIKEEEEEKKDDEAEEAVKFVGEEEEGVPIAKPKGVEIKYGERRKRKSAPILTSFMAITMINRRTKQLRENIIEVRKELDEIDKMGKLSLTEKEKLKKSAKAKLIKPLVKDKFTSIREVANAEFYAGVIPIDLIRIFREKGKVEHEIWEFHDFEYSRDVKINRLLKAFHEGKRKKKLTSERVSKKR